MKNKKQKIKKSGKSIPFKEGFIDFYKLIPAPKHAGEFFVVFRGWKRAQWGTIIMEINPTADEVRRLRKYWGKKNITPKSSAFIAKSIKERGANPKNCIWTHSRKEIDLVYVEDH